MKCELCEKRIWFWQKWISPEELVYYHDICFALLENARIEIDKK